MARTATYINTVPSKTQQQLSADIKKQTEAFLAKGGKIKQIPIGETGIFIEPLRKDLRERNIVGG